MDYDKAFHHASSLLLSAIQLSHSRPISDNLRKIQTLTTDAGLPSISRMSSYSTLRESAYGEVYHARKSPWDPISNVHSPSYFNEKNRVERHGNRIVADHVFNIAVIGACGVGKSNIIDRVSRANPAAAVANVLQIIYRRHIRAYNPTVEDKYSVTLSINETPCKFDIVDTAGQDPYNTTHELPHEEQMRAALENNVLIIVYDIILISSFITIPLLFSLGKHSSRTITMLIGNKVDKEKQR
jgi:hypothetical protein